MAIILSWEFGQVDARLTLEWQASTKLGIWQQLPRELKRPVRELEDPPDLRKAPQGKLLNLVSVVVVMASYNAL